MKGRCIARVAIILGFSSILSSGPRGTWDCSTAVFTKLTTTMETQHHRTELPRMLTWANGGRESLHTLFPLRTSTSLWRTYWFMKAVLCVRVGKNKPTFFFASRLVERLDWCSVFHTHLDHIAREQLVVGYFHYDTLAAKRRERLSPCPHPRGDRNEPVIRLYRRRLSRITPIIWSQDPYLVCVLLSMAQSLRRESRSPKSFIFTARLLVTTKSDFEHIHLFEADITSELLQLFDHPTLSMAGVPWPIIKHKKISFMPYSSFQQRIMTHLLGGSTCPLGLIDGENTGVVAPQASSSKRKFEEEKQISRRVKLKGLGK
ncbi:hypothetical protein FALCPG4_015439 [Fusarium falciforme]